MVRSSGKELYLYRSKITEQKKYEKGKAVDIAVQR